jgi:hypothetical protein
VTYYSWRKKARGSAAPRRARASEHWVGGSNLVSEVRGEVQRRIRHLVSAVVGEEIERALEAGMRRATRAAKRRF